MSVEGRFHPMLPAAAAASDASRWRALLCIATYLALGALVLSPLLWADIPALVDYPNHLARQWVLTQGAALPPELQNYVANWRLLPDLSIDLVVPLLAKVMPLEIAGQVFIAITMALLVIGTAALHRALHGRAGYWPLAALLFLYNAALYWGFISYLFGLGVTLLGFSAWVATERWNLAGRLLLFAPLACLIFLLHLFAFGVYGLLVGSYELGRAWEERARLGARLSAMAARLAQFGPAALLWLASLGDGGPHLTRYGTVPEKIYALFSPTSFGMVLSPLIILCLGSLYVALRRGALRLSPAMHLPLAAAILAALIMPHWLLGSWLADIRLPVALPFLLVASMHLKAARRGIMAGLASLALLALALQIGVVSADWRDMDRKFAEFRATARGLPEGARLLIVESPLTEAAERVPGVPLFLARRGSQSFSHMPALAVIDRDAFIPYLFTGWTPVKPGARNAGRFQSQGLPLKPEQLAESAAPDWRNSPEAQPNLLGEAPYWIDWHEKFDYVLWIDFGVAPASVPASLEPWATGSFFRIYRIVPKEESRSSPGTSS